MKKGSGRGPAKPPTNSLSAKDEFEAKAHQSTSSVPQEDPHDHCENCGKDIDDEQRALFVEEEHGRIFCSEGCIVDFFAPSVEKLEQEYISRVSGDDLPIEDREKLAHIRWTTLQEPDETWREALANGDKRHTLVSKYLYEGEQIYSICITLFLRGEPSFLYLSFVTKKDELVDYYRRGEMIASEERELRVVELVDEENHDQAASTTPMTAAGREMSDWDKEGQGDIPAEEYELYAECLDETVQGSDEVWASPPASGGDLRLLHFIKRFEDEEEGVFWYVVVARETEEAEHIEVLDYFPTRDPRIVASYRQGEQETVEVDIDEETVDDETGDSSNGQVFH